MKNILQSAEKKWEKVLAETYPLGYCIFGIDEKNIVLPYQSKVNQFDIEWSQARIISITRSEIKLNPPSIRAPVKITFRGSSSVILKRTPGSKVGLVCAKGVGMNFQYLYENGDWPIVAMGFKECQDP